LNSNSHQSLATLLDAEANVDAEADAPVNADRLLCNRTGPNPHRWCRLYCKVEGYSAGVCVRHECRCVR